MRTRIMALLMGIVVGSGGTASAFCFDEAGAAYGISPRLLWGISKTPWEEVYGHASR